MRHCQAFWMMTLLVVATPLAVAEEKGEVTAVKAKAITLKVPKDWKSVATRSRFRAAQFSIPGEKPDDEAAELVVYHFGGPTGGIKANVDRWIGQFHEKGRTVKLSQGKSEQGEYVLANVAGTWKKPIGPPFARKTKDTPNSRVIGVILMPEVDGEKDYYFLKFGGPDALVAAQADELRTAMGASEKTEKPYKLEDAEN